MRGFPPRIRRNNMTVVDDIELAIAHLAHVLGKQPEAYPMTVDTYVQLQLEHPDKLEIKDHRAYLGGTRLDVVADEWSGSGS